MVRDRDVQNKLPTRLKHWKHEIERLGRKFGLDFYPNIIEMVGHEVISEVAAFSGYPIRYHHWRFGQESLRMKKSYRWGLHILYELVIPTDPCYSYFLDANPEENQKAVTAHACVGHNDFFKNNVWFQDIPKNLHHKFGDNAARMEEIQLEFGKEKVDQFLEACLSMDNLFDLLQPLVLFEPKKRKEKREHRFPKRMEPREKLPRYMDPYINPPEYLEREKDRIRKEEEREIDIERGVIIPVKPVRDILGFILKYASLEEWQQEVVRIVREESLVLMKGMQTQIMNEGWATFWESEIMAGEAVVLDHEVFPFSRSLAGVQRGSKYKINPYKLGRELWDDIKLRWDTGRHGPIYDECKERCIRDRWEEFIVFKTLFDKHGGLTERLYEEWNEFSTLVHETRGDRGYIRKAYFLPHDWILEWLKYSEAKKKLSELGGALEEVLGLERRFPPYDIEEKETSKFTTRNQIMMQSTSRYRFWSSEELEEEIKHYKFYADLCESVRKKEIPIHKVEILDEWITWARQYEFWGRLGQGFEKMFEIRSSFNDINFIQEFFTQEFCEKYKYFTLGTGKSPQDSFWGEDFVLVKSRDYRRVKRLIISQRLNLGNPKILLWNANFNNNSELRLIHLHDGRDLCYHGCPLCGGRAAGVQKVLERIYTVWNRDKPVHVETIKTAWPKKKPPWHYWRSHDAKDQREKPKHTWVRYSYDGKGHLQSSINFSSLEDVEEIKKALPIIPEDILGS